MVNAPAALQIVTCKNKVRRMGTIEACGKKYLKADKVCPDKDVHLLSMRTGFCSNGWCEGTRPHTRAGVAIKTCEFFVTCPCNCHTMLDKMFVMQELDRILVENPEYHPAPREFWLPSDDPLDVSSTVDDTPRPVILESPAPDRVPASMARDFAPTPSGRAARGELEAWVKHCCDVWLIDEPDELCTPNYLAEEIARDQGITPPSVGAITAVFNRWVKLGFAEITKKPTRFVRYTPEGVKLGLETMKINAKRQEKLERAERERNLVR